jgi:hypothetical protein
MQRDELWYWVWLAAGWMHTSPVSEPGGFELTELKLSRGERLLLQRKPWQRFLLYTPNTSTTTDNCASECLRRPHGFAAQCSCTVRVFRQKFALEDAIGPTPARFKRSGV